MKIDPNVLDNIGQGSMIVKTDANGAAVAWKGPWLEDWYDNYPECLKENQNARRIQLLRKQGLNPQGQTADQEKEFNHRKAVQLQRKQKAEAALLAAKDLEGGK